MTIAPNPYFCFHTKLLAMQLEQSHYAVIFTAHKTVITEDYKAMSAALDVAIQKSPGYLGQDHVGDHTTITVSYWKNLESIQIWRQHTEHLVAQRLGKQEWYDSYTVRICKVERAYQFDRTLGSTQA